MQHWMIWKAVLIRIYWGPLHVTLPCTGCTQHRFWDFRKQKPIKNDYRVNLRKWTFNIATSKCVSWCNVMEMIKRREYKMWQGKEDRISSNKLHTIHTVCINPLNAELNPICYLLALLAHHFLHVSRIRVKSLTLRLLMSYIYIYGAPILDVSRSHTTQHSR